MDQIAITSMKHHLSSFQTLKSWSFTSKRTRKDPKIGLRAIILILSSSTRTMHTRRRGHAYARKYTRTHSHTDLHHRLLQLLYPLHHHVPLVDIQIICHLDDTPSKRRIVVVFVSDHRQRWFPSQLYEVNGDVSDTSFLHTASECRCQDNLSLSLSENK